MCASILTGQGRLTVYGHSEKEVLRKLASRRAEVVVAGRLGARNPKVANYLDAWLDSARLQLRPATIANYSVVIDKHLKPVLGPIRLQRLAPLHVQGLLDRQLEEGYAPRTVAGIRQVLRTALEAGLRWGIVSRNVADLTKGPRRQRYVAQPFSPEEARNFLAWIRGHRREALYALAITLGLRQGELLGLRWDDVDLEAGVLRVRRQLQTVDGHLKLVDLKTDRSNRTLAIPRFVVEVLEVHQEQQVVQRMRVGPKWHENGLVFPNTFGNPLHATTLISEFHQLLEHAGLRRIRFHDQRHTASTLHLLQGASPRVVMEILGHSEIAMTMNLYSHVLPPMHREAADRMEDLLRPIRGRQGDGDSVTTEA